MKNRYRYIVSAVLLSSVLYPLPVCADREIVEVVETGGTCPVYGDDKAPARDSAMDDSMQRAVERVVLSLTSMEIAEGHAGTLADNIYPKYQEYIRGYRILQEGTEDGLYRIRMRVTLSVTDIKRDLVRLGILTDERQPGQSATAVVRVVIRGIGEYGHFKTLRERLERDVREVDAVYLRRIGSGTAAMDIEVQGDATTLADTLQSIQFRNFSLSVREITRNTIELTMEKE